MKLNAEEFKIITKVSQFRADMWHSYYEYIDPRRELKVKVKEMLRHSFLAGCTFTMNSFYEGKEESEKKKNRIIKE